MAQATMIARPLGRSGARAGWQARPAGRVVVVLNIRGMNPPPPPIPSPFPPPARPPARQLAPGAPTEAAAAEASSLRPPGPQTRTAAILGRRQPQGGFGSASGALQAGRLGLSAPPPLFSGQLHWPTKESHANQSSRFWNADLMSSLSCFMVALTWGMAASQPCGSGLMIGHLYSSWQVLGSL